MRLEDWGRRQIEFPIYKMHKPHYVLMTSSAVPRHGRSDRRIPVQRRYLVTWSSRWKRRHRSPPMRRNRRASDRVASAIGIAIRWAFHGHGMSRNHESRFFRRKKYCSSRPKTQNRSNKGSAISSIITDGKIDRPHTGTRSFYRSALGRDKAARYLALLRTPTSTEAPGRKTAAGAINECDGNGTTISRGFLGGGLAS